MQCSDEGSIKVGEKLFAKLLSPMDVNTFMENHWERKSIYINRQQPNYYDKLLGVSTEAINDMLIKNHIQYTKNIDVTSYVDGVRETHNPEGKIFNDFKFNWVLNCHFFIYKVEPFQTPYGICTTMVAASVY